MCFWRITKTEESLYYGIPLGLEYILRITKLLKQQFKKLARKQMIVLATEKRRLSFNIKIPLPVFPQLVYNIANNYRGNCYHR